MVPLIHPALPGEGVWKKAAANAGPRPPVLLTTFRSDPEYPQFVAGVAWIDSARTELAYVPGLAEPPPPLAHRGSAEVPHSMRKRVVATFNGGFPLETSNAGLIYRGKIVEAMVDGIATVVEYRDGRVDIVKWESGGGAPANVWFAKQNLPPIIDEGKLNPNLTDGPEWGETVNNAVRVWRSGIGIDATATCSMRPPTTRPSNRWQRSCSGPARCGRWSSTSTKTGPASSATAIPERANRATCCRKCTTARTLFDPRRTRFLRRLPTPGRKVVRLPRDISPGAAARRSLLADFLIALVLALLAIALAAGIGVVGFAATLILLVLLFWLGIEATLRWGRGRRESGIEKRDCDRSSAR